MDAASDQADAAFVFLGENSEAAGAFQPTGAARLPNEELILVGRTVSLLAGWRARLVRPPTAQIAPGAAVQPAELARLAAPVVADNFEGMAASRGPAGRPHLWLISDDSFKYFQ